MKPEKKGASKLVLRHRIKGRTPVRTSVTGSPRKGKAKKFGQTKQNVGAEGGGIQRAWLDSFESSRPRGLEK